jgi:hypothetical protein
MMAPGSHICGAQGFNLSLVLRLMTGKGTPRGLQDLAIAYFLTLIVLIQDLCQGLDVRDDSMSPVMLKSPHSTFTRADFEIEITATGC